MEYRIVIVTVLVLVCQISCGQQSLEIAVNNLLDFSVDTVHVQVLEREIESSGNIYILDTREEEEYLVSHIPGAIPVGFNQFESTVFDSIPKDASLITYCSVGYRSEKIGKRLEKMGYSNVRNLYGGIFAWKNAGMSVVSPSGETTDSVHTYNRSWSLFLEEGIKVYE
jgi:rhodanese-related sulfurtransferase